MVQEPRVGFDPGGPVRKNELTKVLTDAGITPSQSNFSKVVTDLDVKKDTKHPLHRKTQPIYVEPYKKELIIMKKKFDENQLKSTFLSETGKEAFEKRKARIVELVIEGKSTQQEIENILRSETGLSSKKTIKSVTEELGIKIPSGRERGPKNIKTAKIIKDLNILKNNKALNNLILKPDFNQFEDLLELKKIATEALPKTTADPVRRVGQLLLAYSGEDPELQKYVGEVSDDLVKGTGVVKTKMTKSSRFLSTLQKIAAEKTAAIEIGKPPGFFGSQRKRLGEIINSFKKGLGIEVDEIRAVGGAKAKTSVYDLFVQGVKDTVNQKKGETLDRLTQNAELELQKATTKAKKIKIAEIYNEKVKKFVANANKNLKSGQLPVRAFEISFDPPSETIKNKKAYLQYKDMFDDIHTKHGYSFKVPKDVMTSEQARIFLKTDKGQAQLVKQTALGSQRLYSFPANIDADMFDFRKLPGDVRHFADIAARYGAKSPAFLSALKKAKGAGKWTGWALAGEPAFALPFAEYEYKMGESPERMLGTATWGLAGETEKEELKKATGEIGYATKEIEDYGSTLEALKEKWNSLNDQNDPRGETRQTIVNLYEHTRDKYSKAYNMFVDDQGEFNKGKYDQALNNYTAGLVQIDKFKKQKQDERIEQAGGYENILQEREIRAIKGYATGGLASLMKKKW
jgi:hypothetical protein